METNGKVLIFNDRQFDFGKNQYSTVELQIKHESMPILKPFCRKWSTDTNYHKKMQRKSNNDINIEVKVVTFMKNVHCRQNMSCTILNLNIFKVTDEQ